MEPVAGINEIVLLGLVASAVVAIVAVATERSAVTIGRLAFLKWFAVVIGVPFVISIVVRVFGGHIAGAIAANVVAVCLAWPLYRATVQRARDVGWGKLVPALAVIPMVNVVVFILLFFVKGRPVEEAVNPLPTQAD